MQFTVQREELLSALKAVAGAVDKRQAAQQMLSHVFLEITKNKLCLIATDQDVEIVYEHLWNGNVEIIETGNIILPFKKMFDIVRVIQDKSMINIVEEDSRVILSSKKSRFVLSKLSGKIFPKIDKDENLLKIVVDKKSFYNVMEKTAFAMADQDVRYYLNGMLLEKNGKKLSAIAADGHRLAISTVEIQSDSLEFVKAIVPRKGILEIMKIFANAQEEKIVVMLGKRHILVCAGEITLTANLLEGRFPDYRQAIPQGGNKVITASRETLKSSFVRSATLLNEKFRGVRLKLSAKEVKILAKNSEKDEVVEELDIDYSGDDLDISFNVKYLIDFLNVIDCKNVKFTFIDATRSALLEGLEQGNVLYVVMPMQI